MLRRWTLEGKELRMWKWSRERILVLDFASRCIAMASTLESQS